jgi:predicted alpha/beta superfamily hydrolase
MLRYLFLLFLISSGLPFLAGTDSGKSHKLKLRSLVFGNTRNIRVWTPPGYNTEENKNKRFPVFYFADGSATFSDRAWNAPGIMAQLIAKGYTDSWIIVGIDNGGNTLETTNPGVDRAVEYLPYADQNWSNKPAPTPKGKKFPKFLFEEVMPLVEKRFRVKSGRDHTGLAGASFGGVIALYTGLNHADRIGYLLVESPSLRVGNEQLFKDLDTVKQWPIAIYIGAGTEEGSSPRLNKKYLDRVERYFTKLNQLSANCRLHFEVTQGGQHWFGHWQYRLPVALNLLIGKRH